MVENAELIELLDSETRISKTNFRLGWPASPRDAITISRTTSDESTLIDVSTSLPRSPDAPAYLRPAPPYVRSHLHLFAWCIQAPNSITNSNSDSTPFPTKELKKQHFKDRMKRCLIKDGSRGGREGARGKLTQRREGK